MVPLDRFTINKQIIQWIMVIVIGFPHGKNDGKGYYIFLFFISFFLIISLARFNVEIGIFQQKYDNGVRTWLVNNEPRDKDTYVFNKRFC